MNWTPGSKEHRQLAELLTGENTFATTLLAILIDHYGTAALEAEPEIIRDMTAADFGNPVSDDNMDKLMALTMALTTDQFYHTAESFHFICEALSDTPVNFNLWSPLSLEDMAWGITEVIINDPEEAPKKDPIDGTPPAQTRFSAEVRRYMGVMLQELGVTKGFGMLSDAEFVRTMDANNDDPVMFKAHFDKMHDITAEVDEFVKRRFAALLFQLKSLPLKNRDQKAWTRFLSKVPSSLWPPTEQADKSEEHQVAIL